VAGADVQVVGATEAFRDLERVVEKIDRAAELEARRQAERLVGLVVPKVPRVSGRMAASLAAVDTPGGAAAGYDGSAPWAGWVEYGGSRGRPYVSGGRYLYPTVDAKEIEHELEQVAEHEIARYVWSKPN
jgi:hypothetical protein